MARRGVEYRTIGIEAADSGVNWTRLEWGGHLVVVAGREIDGPITLVRMDDDVERVVEEMVVQAAGEERAIERLTARLERLLGEVEADEFMLIDPGRESRCKPVLLTKGGVEVRAWSQVADQRFTRGWRWREGESFYPGSEVFVFFDGETGAVKVEDRRKV